MNFLSPIFLCLITTGPIILIVGFIMLKRPPKKINRIYGYRTKRSMKSQEQWDFAQKYSAKGLLRGGMLLTLAGISGLFYSAGIIIDTIVGIGLLIAVLVMIIVRTESELRRREKK